MTFFLATCSTLMKQNIDMFLVFLCDDIIGRSHLVKLGRLLQSAPRGPRPAEGLVFVGVDQGEDDEERVVRMLQAGSADQL